MFKAQKGSKDIVKIVHVTSVVQPLFYEAMRILFVFKAKCQNVSSISEFDVFTTVPQTWKLCCCLCRVRKLSDFMKKSYFEFQRRSYRFGTT